jgi:hypothetical protein
VVCDEAGRPYHPDTVSDYWRALCTEAKVPAIRSHDARHTCGTLVHLFVHARHLRIRIRDSSPLFALIRGG